MSDFQAVAQPDLVWQEPVQGGLGGAYVADLPDLRGTRPWQRLLAAYRKDHRSFEIIEQTIKQDFEYHYLVLQDDDGTVRDIQPFFLNIQDVAAGVGSWARLMVRILRKVMPRLLTLRTLMVGSPVCEAHLTTLAEDAQWCAKAMHAALPALGRRYRASLLVLKEFPAAHRDNLACFSNNGYARIPSMPYATLELNFANFDQYMGNVLGKSFRKDLRRKFRDADRAGRLSMTVVSDITPYIDEVYPLYLQVYDRARLKFEKLTPDYLCRLGRECPDRARFFIWRLAGKAIAFSACTIHDGAIWDEYLGLDYSLALDLHLYFVTFRDLINWACEQKLTRYYTTALNYDPKLHLRCMLAPLDLYVRHTNPLLNFFFRRFVRLLRPTRSDPAIARFPNAHEL
jgi:predicted N-acyltransferase